MANQTTNIIVPTDAKQLKQIKKMVQEGCDCLLRIDAEREALKDIIEAINEEFEIPKQYLSRLIKHKHKEDFDKKSTEHSDFETLYEAVFSA
jgi:uncharacterized protein YwgA